MHPLCLYFEGVTQMDKFFVRIPVHGYFEYDVTEDTEHAAIIQAERLAESRLKSISDVSGIKGLTSGSKAVPYSFYSTRISPKFTCKCGSTTFQRVNSAKRIIQFTNGKFIQNSECSELRVICIDCCYDLNNDEIDQLLKEIKG